MSFLLFMPLLTPPIAASEALRFRVVCLCVRPLCVRPGVRRVSTNKWTEFHFQTLVNGVVEATDELIRF